MGHVLQLLAVLGLISVTGVVADDCAPYMNADYAIQPAQTCFLSFCSGTCTNRYCNVIPGTMLDQSQIMCILNNLYFIIGAGITISLLFVVGIVTCCCKSLCLCCGLFRSEPRSHLNTSVAVTSVVPHQPLIQMPVAAGYQPVPSQSVYAGQPDKAYYPPPYPGEATAQSSYPTK